jgi:hypothetical protein
VKVRFYPTLSDFRNGSLLEDVRPSQEQHVDENEYGTKGTRGT